MEKQRLRQTTSHSSLLAARQGDVSRKLNQVILLVDSFNFNFLDEDRSDIYVVVHFLLSGHLRLAATKPDKKGLLHTLLTRNSHPTGAMDSALVL